MPIPLSTLRWLPVIIVTGGLCVAASVPGSSLPAFLHNGFDKTVHGIVYGLLAASYLYGFGKRGHQQPYRISVVTGIICLSYAIFEEWYQQFVPGRVSDRLDLLADCIGVSIVIGLWLPFTLTRHRNE